MTTKVTIEAAADLEDRRHVLVEKRVEDAPMVDRYLLRAGVQMETHVWKGVTLTVTEESAVIVESTPYVQNEYIESRPLNGPTIRHEFPKGAADMSHRHIPADPEHLFKAILDRVGALPMAAYRGHTGQAVGDVLYALQVWQQMTGNGISAQDAWIALSNGQIGFYVNSKLQADEYSLRDAADDEMFPEPKAAT